MLASMIGLLFSSTFDPSLIGSYGFPIVACGCMAWYVKYITDKNREEITRLTDAHKEETDKLASVIENNTLILQKVYNKLGGDMNE